MIHAVADHLWQSTLFTGLVGLLTLMLRRNRAAVRHKLWLTASIKFLVPFSLLITIGKQVQWRQAPAYEQPHGPSLIEQVSRRVPFSFPAPAPSQLPTDGDSRRVPVVLFGLWLCGFGANCLAWWRRSLRLRTAMNNATPLDLNAPVRVLSSSTPIEPGVFGICKPVVVVPEGIVSRLTPSQFQAILAHEFCHVRRRDNLAAAIHMLVEALFWFHPLVWWIEARLIEERERACDEEVLRKTGDPRDYAEGILSVCKFYLESPVICVSGVTGSNLKRRVEAIMLNRDPYKLSPGRKLVLTLAGMLAVAGPLAVGVLNAPPVRAQSTLASTSEFEVASVKQLDRSLPPGQPDVSFVGTSGKRINIAGTRVTIRGTLRVLIAAAYDLKDYQISGTPEWAGSLLFDVDARTPGDAALTQEQVRPMLQSLLADRFQLKLHRESKEFPVYYLMPSKKGMGLKAAGSDETFHWNVTPDGEGMARSKATRESIGDFVQLVGASADRPVINKTGLTGYIDYDIRYSTAGVRNWDDMNRSILDAVKDQLGLKLEPARDLIDTVVVDGVQKLSAN